MTVRALLAAAALAAAFTARADLDPASRQLAHDILKQLVEINTADSVGNVTTAAEALAQRFRDAGFPEKDISILSANDKRKNLVVRLHGNGRKKPILMIGHLDVVEARREDWNTDPFQFIEKDGYYYGRGTQDMKDGVTIEALTLIRLHKEGYHGDRDLIAAFTAGEESGLDNGVDWLTKHHMELIEAEFALNHDGPSLYAVKGKPAYLEIDASEKVYADFQLSVANPGGHSSVPTSDNAIYHLALALNRLAAYEFPFELNAVTRAYYESMAKSEQGDRAANIRGMLASSPDPEAIKRLSRDSIDHATTHTTCVATRLEGGHANNALPQMARAVVNCRILPGHEPEAVREELIRVFADPKVAVRYIGEGGEILETAESKHGFSAPVLRKDVVDATHRIAGEMWPGLPIVPMMSAGASDAVYANAAGLPTYQVTGELIDRDDVRAHGQDERIGVEAFYRGAEFHYRFIKELTARR
ncbi:MAG TPA: M20/M25/M40 family metallo-hydrolase [Steroidobacteraceae bacterium]|nr:M20/M25/M40 family metallo-hydrolase [Steroidobacteraceae bacterium]